MFLIERNYGEKLELTPEVVGAVTSANDTTGVQWLYSFLTANKKKTYCLYEAVSAEAVREAARRCGIPADVVIEVSDINPENYGVIAATHS